MFISASQYQIPNNDKQHDMCVRLKMVETTVNLLLYTVYDF